MKMIDLAFFEEKIKESLIVISFIYTKDWVGASTKDLNAFKMNEIMI